MPRYKLQTLLIVLALGPMVLAVGWWKYARWSDREDRKQQVERFSDLARKGPPPANTAEADQARIRAMQKAAGLSP
jgi:hypothetical protein